MTSEVSEQDLFIEKLNEYNNKICHQKPRRKLRTKGSVIQYKHRNHSDVFTVKNSFQPKSIYNLLESSNKFGSTTQKIIYGYIRSKIKYYIPSCIIDLCASFCYSSRMKHFLFTVTHSCPPLYGQTCQGYGVNDRNTINVFDIREQNHMIIEIQNIGQKKVINTKGDYRKWDYFPSCNIFTAFYSLPTWIKQNIDLKQDCFQEYGMMLSCDTRQNLFDLIVWSPSTLQGHVYTLSPIVIENDEIKEQIRYWSLRSHRERKQYQLEFPQHKMPKYPLHGVTLAADPGNHRIYVNGVYGNYVCRLNLESTKWEDNNVKLLNIRYDPIIAISKKNKKMYVISGYEPSSPVSHENFIDDPMGKTYDHTIERFSIADGNYGDDHNLLTHQMKYERMGAGAVFDDIHDQLFVGGGRHVKRRWRGGLEYEGECGRSVEMYDMTKDKICILPNRTNAYYAYGTRLFYADIDKGNNVLCIAGKTGPNNAFYDKVNTMGSVSCEWIDLRENTSKWNAAWNKTSTTQEIGIQDVRGRCSFSLFI